MVSAFPQERIAVLFQMLNKVAAFDGHRLNLHGDLF
jgi:hypothetical protein